MDNPGIYLVYAVLALIIQCIILSWVISSSTKSGQKIALDKVKVKLLVHIAEKLGVEPDKIHDAIKDL